MWELDHKEGWALKNWYLRTVVLEKTLMNPLETKEIKPVYCKGNHSWIFNRRTDAEAEGSSNTLPIWWEEMIQWKRPWCWERLKAGEGDDRGWGGWIASPTWWTWVWVRSRSWWWTGKPGVAAIHGVTKSQTRLSDWIELLQKKIKDSWFPLPNWLLACPFLS